jgi:hypothetical protein
MNSSSVTCNHHRIIHIPVFRVMILYSLQADVTFQRRITLPFHFQGLRSQGRSTPKTRGSITVSQKRRPPPRRHKLDVCNLNIRSCVYLILHRILLQPVSIMQRGKSFHHSYVGAELKLYAFLTSALTEGV